MTARFRRRVPLELLLFAVVGWQAAAASAWSQQSMCDSREYHSCIAMADPLIRDPQLVFPDNMNDIDNMCRIWSKFVDCVKRYTERCFSAATRQQFNQAVQRSVDSVHQICTATPYRTEYLSHAKCIKSTLTEEAHCGMHYRDLADIVAGQEPVSSRVHICCSHHRFRDCVLRETRRQCDSGVTGSATRFASHILDKALSFLREDCTNYIPASGECPKKEAIVPPGGNEKLQPPPMRYPAANTPARNRDMSRFAMGMGRSSRFPDDLSIGLTASSPPAPPYKASTPAAFTSSPNMDVTPWTPGRVESSTNAVAAGSPSTDWEATWDDTSTKIYGLGDGNIYVHSTESWYPQAGIHNGIIDEPNQQGLQRGEANSWKQISLSLLFITLAIVSYL